MTMRHALPQAAAALAAVALLALPASAQDAPPPPPPDTSVVELVLLREAFDYPAFQRRNPFAALTSAAEGGPRFDQMRLQLILYFENDPARSIAVLAAGGGESVNIQAAQTETARGQVRRMSIGERWGNVRVVAIQPDYILVDVSEFGLAERREMRLQNRGQGGS
jgi:hypothetical protein